MSYVEHILDVVNRYEPLGSRLLANGTRLIGHVPQVAPEAYLHILYPGLAESGIARIESSIGQQLALSLKKFYKNFNGLDLFSGALSIYGLRDGYARSGDAAWQPFSISIPNVEERIRDAEPDMIFFGFYDWDGSLLYLTGKSTKVYRCSRDSAKALNEWPDLGSMLLAETDRISALFDENGVRIDEDVPSSPETD